MLEVTIPQKFYRINQYIQANELRVVDERGGQLGVMTKAEALAKAQAEDKDLIVVAEKANPPVAKIINFSKFKYQQQQKEASGRKKANSVEIKEIRFTPFIAQGDFDVRIKKAREFLTDGNKVRLNVKFLGRQITRKEFGDSLLAKAIESLQDIADVEREPSMMGKILSTQLQPKRKHG